MGILKSLLIVSTIAGLLCSCEGPVAATLSGELVNLTLFFGRALENSVVAQGVAALFDKAFSRNKNESEGKIIIHNSRHATATKLRIQKSDGSCNVEAENVSLSWDTRRHRWKPDRRFLEQAEAICRIRAHM